LGDQEDTVALTGNRAADELLGAVDFRRVDQRHAERDACAQRFLFNGLRMSSLSKTRGPLSQGRDDGAIRKLDRPSCGCADARGRALGECTRWRRKHRAGGKERRRAKSGELPPVQRSTVHSFASCAFWASQSIPFAVFDGGEPTSPLR